MEILKPTFEDLSRHERSLIDSHIDLARESLITDEKMSFFLRKLEEGPGRTTELVKKHRLTNKQKILMSCWVAAKNPCYLCGEPVIFGVQYVRLKPFRTRWWGDATPEQIWAEEKNEPVVFFFSLCNECVVEPGWFTVATNKAIDEASRGVLKLLR